MTLVLEAMDAYDIVTSEEPEPPQNDIDYHDWKIRAAKAKTTIHLSCSPAIQFLLKGLRSPGAMWTTLLARLENTGTHVGRTTIQRKFRACRLQKDQTLREYFTLLRDYRLQLIGTPQASAKNISVRAEWLRQSGRAPSEPRETPRWRIPPRPASIPCVALHIALRSPFRRFLSLCLSRILNKHSGVVANCNHTSEWVHWVHVCIGIAMGDAAKISPRVPSTLSSRSVGR